MKDYQRAADTPCWLEIVFEAALAKAKSTVQSSCVVECVIDVYFLWLQGWVLPIARAFLLMALDLLM